MNHRDNKKYVNPSQIPVKQEHGQSISIKQTNHHRSCLKHQSNLAENGKTGRVSFLHDGKLQIPSQSQLDLVEKKHRSATFAKKAKELQRAELNYFKDHAQDKEPNDE
jgi:hypothetical protein